MSFPPRRTVHLLCAAALAPAAGCGTAAPPGPAVPEPPGPAAADCRTLHPLLPEEIEGNGREEREPVSEYTAAWGDPPMELRCGVPRPEVLTPGSEHYNPTADAVEVNGVEWLLEELPDGYRFTTTGRTAFVEMTVPDRYAPEVGPLTDLAGPVREAVPEQDP